MVRRAEIKDIPAIIQLFREQAPETHLKHAESGFSPRKTSNLILSSIKQQFAWVYDKDGLKGVLIGENRFNMFSDSIKEAHLLAIYVKPEFRKGMAGGRLILEFIKECDDRETPMIWIGSNVESDLNEQMMNKLGFKLQEQFYLKER